MTQVSEAMQTRQIDHPAQKDWWSIGRENPNKYQKELLDERFKNTSVNPAEIADAVGYASLQTFTRRHMHQQVTLGVFDRNNVADKSEYDNLAGQPDKIKEYLAWFSGSVAAFDNMPEDDRHKYDRFGITKLGLDLGGIRQLGDWGNTGYLDQIFRDLSAQVAADTHAGNRSVSLVHRQTPKQRAIAYRYSPFDDDEGLARRRRAVADMIHPNGVVIRIVKESLGLVVLSQLSADDRRKIQKDTELVTGSDYEKELYRMRNSFTNKGLNNTTAANLAGNLFRNAIYLQDSCTNIVPVSAHYFAVASMRNVYKKQFKAPLEHSEPLA